MQNYEIIPMTEEYIEGFHAAVDSVAREHKYLAFLEGPLLEMSRAFVLENLQGGWPHFVAMSEGKVIGWCDITSLHRPVFAHSGALGIGVLASYRGQGIGEALIRAALNQAKSIGLTRVELTVRENNKPAITLYEKLGFVVEGLHRNAVRIGTEYENHISMALLFVGRAHSSNNEVTSHDMHKPNINYNKIMLIPATLEDYPTIQNMGRFYVYDMSEYMGNGAGWEMPKDGLYECINFKKYWEDNNAFPFLIRYGDELVGFAIVDKKGSNTTIDFNMAQFFIIRKFKHQGVGRYVAHQCFKKFIGVWEIMVIPGNEGAYHFWRAIIKDFNGDNFTEYTREISHFNNSVKNIFKFDSKI